jgi:hypothetical protein
MERIQLVLPQSMPQYTLSKLCCIRNLMGAGWWFIMYNIQQILLIPHIAPSMDNTCMPHESAHFSQITMHYFKHMLVRLSPIQKMMLLFPQCSKRMSLTKTIHKIHICKLWISIPRHFRCFHCHCYQYYYPRPIIVLHCLLSWSLSMEPHKMMTVILSNIITNMS